MAANSNLQERKCKFCDLPAFLKSKAWRCARHHRYAQMRREARYQGKLIPTFEELDAMPGSNLICPTCDIKMNWFSSEGGRARVAALQHYRDGSLAIVCLACNTRHGAMPGDQYRELPKEHKRCPRCTEIKPHAEFFFVRWGDRPPKISSSCRQCRSKVSADWQKANKDRVNEGQRKRYQARKGAQP